MTSSQISSLFQLSAALNVFGDPIFLKICHLECGKQDCPAHLPAALSTPIQPSQPPIMFWWYHQPPLHPLLPSYSLGPTGLPASFRHRLTQTQPHNHAHSHFCTHTLRHACTDYTQHMHLNSHNPHIKARNMCTDTCAPSLHTHSHA